MAVHEALTQAGAVPRLVAPKLGMVASNRGVALEADGTLETMPAVTFDAVVVAGGDAAASVLCDLGQAVEFVTDQYRHCKAIFALGAGAQLLEKAGIDTTEDDRALILTDEGDGKSVDVFIKAIGEHRNWDRALDPPPV